MTCTTHHHACECREARHAALVADLQARVDEARAQRRSRDGIIDSLTVELDLAEANADEAVTEFEKERARAESAEAERDSLRAEVAELNERKGILDEITFDYGKLQAAEAERDRLRERMGWIADRGQNYQAWQLRGVARAALSPDTRKQGKADV